MSETTHWYRAVMPVLGIRRGQLAELADSDYLRLVVARGWLEKATKADAKAAGVLDAPPVVDPAVAQPGE